VNGHKDVILKRRRKCPPALPPTPTIGEHKMNKKYSNEGGIINFLRKI